MFGLLIIPRKYEFIAFLHVFQVRSVDSRLSAVSFLLPCSNPMLFGGFRFFPRRVSIYCPSLHPPLSEKW